MKLYYLSSSAYSDNQINILKYLQNYYDVTYAVIIPYTNSNYNIEELSSYCETNQINFTPFLLKRRFRDPRLLRSYLSIIHNIKKEDPDIIYFANFDQIYLNILLLLLSKNKTIIALHDVESHSGTAFNYLANLSKKILIKKFNYFHTYSTIQCNILKDIAPRKLIYNISLPILHFGSPVNRSKNENIVNFLFFGFILYYKGLDILIKAFNNIAKKYPNAQLTIAGRCKDWTDNYEPLLNGSPQIRTHIRFIENSEIADYFSNADYVVLPYRDTTQSGPLMIAYNYNVPVLVSDADGFKEFTSEGNTGYSFKLNVNGDLERILETSITRNKEEYKGLKIRLEDYKKRNFSTEFIINKYNVMFKDVLSKQ